MLTNASSSRKPLVTNIMKAEMKKAGLVVSNAICSHFSMSRADLFSIVKIKQLKTFAAVMKNSGVRKNALGCEICKVRRLAELDGLSISPRTDNALFLFSPALRRIHHLLDRWYQRACHGRGPLPQSGCVQRPTLFLAWLVPDLLLPCFFRFLSAETNDKFLANIQRDGTYSVVPRMAAGEVTPDGLIAVGR